MARLAWALQAATVAANILHMLELMPRPGSVVFAKYDPVGLREAGKQPLPRTGKNESFFVYSNSSDCVKLVPLVAALADHP